MRRGFTLIELLVALFITAVIFVMGYGAINQALKDQQSLKDQQARLTAVQNAMRVLVQDFTQLTPRPVRDELGDSSLPCLIGSPGGISLTGGPVGAAASAGSLTLGTSTAGISTDLGASVSLESSSSAASSSDASSSSGSESSESSESASGAAGGFAQSSGTQSGIDLVAFTRIGWANPAGIQRPAEERVAYRLANGVLERLHWPELDAAEGTTPVSRDLLDHVKSVTFRYMTDTRQWTDQWPPVSNIPLAPLAGDQTLRMRPIAVEVTLELEDWGTIVRIIEVPT